MRDGRLAIGAFAALVVATVGAFYLTQHLKTQNPFYNGAPRFDPDVINPRYAGSCIDLKGERVSFRQTRVGFFLQTRADTALVSIVNAEDQVVATATGSGRHLVPNQYAYYGWDGRLSDGAYAPAGRYGLQIGLLSQGRTIIDPIASVQVLRARPQPKVSALSVIPDTTTTGTTTNATTTTTAGTVSVTTATSAIQYTPNAPVITPGRQSVRINWQRPAAPYAHLSVLVYRASDNPAKPLTLVQTLRADPATGHATWDGRIDGVPAPAGTYLLGLRVVDRACVSATVPATRTPAAGADPGAGVSVRYLTALTPSTPIVAGHIAAIQVDSAGAPFAWALRLDGSSRVVAHGEAPPDTTVLHLRIPAEGLYAATLRTATRSLTVPLVASHAHPGATVLVVLPALTWQGENPVDDDGDGVVDTLVNGQIDLDRPLVNGLPAGYGDEASLISYLASQHDSFQLTTDVALDEGVGPSLTGFHGVLLDGTFTWLPTGLTSRLQAFVRAGGAVFNDGVDSLEYAAPIGDGTTGPVAGPATQLTTDPFGVTRGTVTATGGESIFAQQQGPLNIFSNVTALQFPRYQPLQAPSGVSAATAGVSSIQPAIVGFRLGDGTVVEIGLPGFGSHLSSDPNAQDLLRQIFQTVLG